jgi:hypothetical protein
VLTASSQTAIPPHQLEETSAKFPKMKLTEESDVQRSGASISSLMDTEVDEKALLRKMDIRFLPWLSFLYFLSFLDRTSIGNAKVRLILFVSVSGDLNVALM